MDDAGADCAVYIKELARNPAYFVTEVLGGRPWAKQIEIAEAVRDHKHVAVRSCHGIGKDWIAARIVLWFTYVFSPVRTITTGPTARQVTGILWKEIATAHAHAREPLGGRVLTQELHLTDECFAIGFTTTTSGDSGASRFQGWHAQNILVVIDEASGVIPEIYNEISGLLSSANAHLLEIGNPTNPRGEFAAAFKTPGVYKIKVDAFDTPNFTTFGITQQDIEDNTWQAKINGPLPYPELITPEWVAERYRKWGKGNPLYQSRVLAEFPQSSNNTLISLSQIEAAQQRDLEQEGTNVLGVDVARFGSNYTVIAHRQGPVVRVRKRFPKIDTMETAGHVFREIRTSNADSTWIDVVGLGAGVFDRLRELRAHGIHEFNGGSKPIDGERFVNARAEAYWNLREAAEKGELDLDAQDEDLAAQLSDIRWHPDSRGRVQIESKEDMLKRGVQSPDDADAVSMTYSGVSDSIELYKRAMENIR